MANRLENDVRAMWLGLKNAGGISIRYVDGGDMSAPIEAVVGESSFELETEAEIYQTHKTQDFILPTSTLILAGGVVKPRRLSLIQWLDADDPNTVLATFEINAPGDEKHYRYSDQFRYLLRIHSVETDLTQLIISGDLTATDIAIPAPIVGTPTASTDADDTTSTPSSIVIPAPIVGTAVATETDNEYGNEYAPEFA